MSKKCIYPGCCSNTSSKSGRCQSHPSGTPTGPKNPDWYDKHMGYGKYADKYPGSYNAKPKVDAKECATSGCSGKRKPYTKYCSSCSSIRKKPEMETTMNKNELQSLIRECLTEILEELNEISGLSKISQPDGPGQRAGQPSISSSDTAYKGWKCQECGKTSKKHFGTCPKCHSHDIDLA